MWTATELRWVLEYLPELVLGGQPSRPIRPQRRTRLWRPPPQFLTAERLADLERALARLRAEDERLASVILAIALRPDLRDLPRVARIVLWGEEHGLDARDAWHLAETAFRRLLAILNGESPEG